MNYLVYLCCIEFLSSFNYPRFFLGGASASKESINVRCFSKFQTSSNDQANSLRSLKILLVQLTDVGKPKSSHTKIVSPIFLLSVSLALFRERHILPNLHRHTCIICWVVYLHAG